MVSSSLSSFSVIELNSSSNFGSCAPARGAGPGARARSRLERESREDSLSSTLSPEFPSLVRRSVTEPPQNPSFGHVLVFTHW